MPRPRSASSVTTVYDGPPRTDLDVAHRERRVAGDREPDHRQPVARPPSPRVPACAAAARTGRTPRARAPATRGRPPRWRGARDGSGRTSRRGSPPSPAHRGTRRERLRRQTVTGGPRPAPTRARSPPIVTVSPGRTPARRSASSMPSFEQVALEPLGGLLVLEVGLGDEALDPLAAHVVAVRLPARGVPVPCRLEPVDDHPGGLRRLGEPGGIGQQLREGGTQRVEALARVGGDRQHRDAGRARIAASNAGHASRASGRSSLLNTTSCALPEQRRVVRLELVADHLVVPARRRGRRRRRCAAATRVRSTWRRNAWPRPAPARRPFDQPGDVGDRRPAPVLDAEVQDPEVRLERRERVGRDLRAWRRSGRRGASTCRRSGSPTSPTSAIRRSSSRSSFSSPGSPRWACLGAWWVAVAKWVLPRPPRPPLATMTSWPTATRSAISAAGREVDHGRPGRDGEEQVVTGLAVALLALAAAARRRPEVVLVAEVVERRLAGIDPQVDRAAASAVAAVGSAARHVGLPAHRRRAVAARTGAHEDPDVVEEHRGDCRTRPGAGPRADRRAVRAPRSTAAG